MRWSPCKRREFIRRLRKLGFDGPIKAVAFLESRGHRYALVGSMALSQWIYSAVYP